jgi:glutamyl/glutaminyl-tRNA synthetase
VARLNSKNAMSQTVVTRFAPSPTGYLHIGSARTALFCWAYARHHGGKFLLRVEDTDRERSTDDAVQAIYDGLTWLGLNWDGEPTLQFGRAARHAEIARELLARGQAYYCYCSPEELAQMREEARAASRRRFRARSSSTTTCRARWSSGPRTSTISSSCARMEHRPTCSPWWWTTTTWASPTSSAATTT